MAELGEFLVAIFFGNVWRLNLFISCDCATGPSLPDPSNVLRSKLFNRSLDMYH